MAAERVLVNFFYAQQVGHAVEALHYCHGHASAVPGREVSVVLNAATATELAGFCPFLAAVHPVDHPFLEPCADSARRMRDVPRDWDWVLDDTRRHQPVQYELSCASSCRPRRGGPPPTGWRPTARWRAGSRWCRPGRAIRRCTRRPARGGWCSTP
ncbi:MULTISPECIES: hypothetical protein [unclassified Geodermatophilus]|uniref:hypothetical protein n=1 Tax=unclassified Geodermatophilus TaxID=2637632 RepID=UPI003EEE6C0B